MVDSEIEICHTEVTSTLLHKRDDSQSYDGDKYYNNCESMPGSRHTKRQFCLCFVGLIAPVLTFVWGWELSRYHYWGLYVRRLPGDYAFGPIPMQEVVFEEDRRFVDSDLFEQYLNGTDKTSVWDQYHIADGYLIELETSLANGIYGGLPPKFFSSDISSSVEAFSLSINHQLHCIIQLKGALLGHTGDFFSRQHTDHCLEIIRQALVCFGDVTLEKPVNVTKNGWGGFTGWGVKHYCRDWSYIYDFIEEHAIPHSALIRDDKDSPNHKLTGMPLPA